MATVQLRPTRIPESYAELVQRPVLGRLTTLLPNGYAQTHPVWFDVDGDCLRVNTMREFRKARNMARDPRVTLLVLDPADTNCWIEVRGVVDLTVDGAAAHLDHLARRYLQVERYADCIPAEFTDQGTPVIGRITPLRIVTAEMATIQSRSPRSPRRDPLPPPRVSLGDSRAVVPESHRPLLSQAVVGAMSTLMPDGSPQTQPVWFEFDGQDFLFNTSRERRKGRNLEADPRATVLVVDPADGNRWVEARGEVSINLEGAVEHLDRLTQRYTGKPHFYGGVYPEEIGAFETRIICRLTPNHVKCDAVFH